MLGFPTRLLSQDPEPMVFGLAAERVALEGPQAAVTVLGAHLSIDPAAATVRCVFMDLNSNGPSCLLKPQSRTNAYYSVGTFH